MPSRLLKCRNRFCIGVNTWTYPSIPISGNTIFLLGPDWDLGEGGAMRHFRSSVRSVSHPAARQCLPIVQPGINCRGYLGPTHGRYTTTGHGPRATGHGPRDKNDPIWSFNSVDKEVIPVSLIAQVALDVLFFMPSVSGPSPLCPDDCGGRPESRLDRRLPRGVSGAGAITR